MYFSKDNNFFHGIMFHHFHDDKFHTKSQGSISKDDLYQLIKFIGKKNILSADIFFERFKNNKLKSTDVCLSFDDGIKSQIDVALPVLEDCKIKSFFFIYSSIFSGDPDNLEIFRFFRMNYFNSIDTFYEEFFEIFGENLNSFFKSHEKTIIEKKFKHPLYSTKDIEFRLVRDTFSNKYEEAMFKMMKMKNFNAKDHYPKLFLNKSDLKNLDSLGHLVGLHSHDHATLIENLSYESQKKQYLKNKKMISKILNKDENEIKYMSHPCGSYNQDTLKILKEIGVELGFKQIMKIEPEKGMKKINNSVYEIARVSHSIIMKSLTK